MYVSEITPEITVFRYSKEKMLQYLRVKVARLSDQSIGEVSRTLNRSLAKDGLMEDGKESLLACEYTAFHPTSTPDVLIFAVARVRMACDLVSQYLPRDVYDTLLSSYEYVVISFRCITQP